MRVGIVVPWRDDGPERAKAKAVTETRLRQMLPGAEYVEADSGHDDFNRAASRNLGVRLAEAAGCEVVVICDADSIPEEAPLRAAIEAASDDRLHLPYTRFVSLSERGTTQYLSGMPVDLCRVLLDWEESVGGCLVITPAAYWRAGGQDERFLGWGCEDTAFHVDCEKTLGATVRHSGALVHLYHPATRQLTSPATALLAERL
ncbi:galactosyltransferase-related protein [Plantactinospora solaniradicis]|uniref:Galactosyltransferase-related protein n=1 Tax=Plantactinospora solaniradicis TaxID=1723736 RepID=A0ABW1KR50_9ACTN